MLVLTREVSERIIITVPPSDVPTPIELVLVDIRGCRARVGIEAKREVVVHRSEVQAVIDREGK